MPTVRYLTPEKQFSSGSPAQARPGSEAALPVRGLRELWLIYRIIVAIVSESRQHARRIAGTDLSDAQRLVIAAGWRG
jgi:hypothetical protein